MLQIRTPGGLALAAGLWVSATAALAAPQPESAMQLGSTALPPAGYVAFCERQPWDCGADAQIVLAGARQADQERAELFALASPVTLGAPAALSGSAAPLEAAETATAQTGANQSAANQTVAGQAAAEQAVADAKLVQPAVQTVVAAAAPISAPPASPPLAATEPQAEDVAPVRMTPELWSKLNRINAQVNGAISEASDQATYGQADYWSTPLEDGVRRGDCEDYVLEKERALIAAGLPRGTLNIAVVSTRWGETHAVLLVSTSDGEFVLDNLSPWVKPWDKAGYRWRQRQVNGDPFTWVMVRDPSRQGAPRARQMVVAAAR